jgi:hypothetical protein
MSSRIPDPRRIQPSRLSSRGWKRGALLIGAVGVGLLLLVAPARADDEEYDPRRAGNPLRIVAYILHPVGVAIDYLILRPAWWVGSHEPFRTIFGRTD